MLSEILHLWKSEHKYSSLHMGEGGSRGGNSELIDGGQCLGRWRSPRYWRSARFRHSSSSPACSTCLWLKFFHLLTQGKFKSIWQFLSYLPVPQIGGFLGHRPHSITLGKSRALPTVLFSLIINHGNNSIILVIRIKLDEACPNSLSTAKHSSVIRLLIPSPTVDCLSSCTQICKINPAADPCLGTWSQAAVIARQPWKYQKAKAKKKYLP